MMTEKIICLGYQNMENPKDIDHILNLMMVTNAILMNVMRPHQQER